MIKIFEHNGEKEYHVVDDESPEGFDPIVEYFVNAEGATPVKLSEGAASRIAQLSIKKCSISVYYQSGLGTYFTFSNPERNKEGIARVVKALDQELRTGGGTAMSLQPGTTKSVQGKTYVLNQNHRWTLPDTFERRGREPTAGQLGLFDSDTKDQSVIEKTSADPPKPKVYDFAIKFGKTVDADIERNAVYRTEIRELPVAERAQAKREYYKQAIDYKFASFDSKIDAVFEFKLLNDDDDSNCTSIMFDQSRSGSIADHAHRTVEETQKRILQAVLEADKFTSFGVKSIRFTNGRMTGGSRRALGICTEFGEIDIHVNKSFNEEAGHKYLKIMNQNDASGNSSKWVVGEGENRFENTVIHEIGHAKHFSGFKQAELDEIRDSKKEHPYTYDKSLRHWHEDHRTWAGFLKSKDKAWLVDFAKTNELMKPDVADASKVAKLRDTIESGLRKLIVEELSEYGSTCPVELVAETFVQLQLGQPVHPQVMSLFKIFKGVEPDKVRNAS